MTVIRSSLKIPYRVPELDAVNNQCFRETVSVESHRLSETIPLLAGLFDRSGTVFQATTSAHEVDDLVQCHSTVSSPILT